MSRLIFILFIFIFFISCRQADSNPFIDHKPQKLDKETSINLNKYWIQDEHFQIEKYCDRQGWKMNKTSSGLSYMEIVKSDSKISPNVGDEVTLSYDVRLMD